MDRLDVLDLIKKISNQWQIIVVLMIIGGLAGLLGSLFIQPIYESSATYSVTIDYTQTGALTDIQEDQAMRGVGSVLMSDRVISQTLSQLKDIASIELNQSDFLRDASIDREEFRWTIRFKATDKVKAESVVRIWAEAADEVINQALVHANTNQVLAESMSALKICVQGLSQKSQNEICGCFDPRELVNVIGEISGQMQKEKEESLGLFHALSVVLINGASQAQSPVLGQRNVLVLSGVFIGLIISLVITAALANKRS